MGFWNAPGLALGSFLVVGGLYDIFRRRIPNWLNLVGLIAALAIRFFENGGVGLADAGFGAGAGLLCLLPLYAFASMGAGDVKMMAVVGVFVGAANVVIIALVSVLVAGAMSVGVILLRGELPALCRRYGAMLTHVVVAQELAYVPPRPGEWAGRRMAFAPAIGIAAAIVLVWRPDWLSAWL